MSNDTPHDLVQSQPQSHVSYTSIGGGRAPVMFSARIETADIGVNVTQREGRKPSVEVDGDPAYTRRVLTQMIDMLTTVRDKIAPEAPRPLPCVGLEPGYPGNPAPDERDPRNDPRLHTSRPASNLRWGHDGELHVSPEVQKVLDEEGVKLVPLVDTGVGDARPVSLGG